MRTITEGLEKTIAWFEAHYTPDPLATFVPITASGFPSVEEQKSAIIKANDEALDGIKNAQRALTIWNTLLDHELIDFILQQILDLA